ncbi:MAG: hypothetical protein ACJAWI_001604 [Marinomonas primoryensis]|jgi:hypothetical protein
MRKNMKFKYLTSLTLALGLVFSSLVTAAPKDRTQLLLDASGMSEQIGMLANMVSSSVLQGETDMSPEEREKTSEVFAKAFHEDKFKSFVHDEVNAALSPKDVEALLVWYGSDLGKRITSAETLATNAPQQELLTVLNKSRENQALMKIAADVLALTKSSELVIELQKNIALSAFAAASAHQAPGKPLNFDQVKPLIDQQMEMNRGQVEVMMLAYILYGWKDITMDDLKKYEAVLKAEAGTKFLESGNAGIFKGMSLAFSDAMYNLVEIYKTKP